NNQTLRVLRGVDGCPVRGRGYQRVGCRVVDPPRLLRYLNNYKVDRATDTKLLPGGNPIVLDRDADGLQLRAERLCRAFHLDMGVTVLEGDGGVDGANVLAWPRFGASESCMAADKL